MRQLLAIVGLAWMVAGLACSSARTTCGGDADGCTSGYICVYSQYPLAGSTDRMCAAPCDSDGSAPCRFPATCQPRASYCGGQGDCVLGMVCL